MINQVIDQSQGREAKKRSISLKFCFGSDALYLKEKFSLSLNCVAGCALLPGSLAGRLNVALNIAETY